MDDQKKYAIIAESQISRAILINIEPMVKKQAQSILDSLKANFREGKCDIVEMSSLVAQLCALDDLTNSLSSKIRRSERIDHENE